MNTIPDLIWLKSEDGRYLFVNNRFEDFFGAKEQDIVGKTDYDFVDKELADLFRMNDKKAIYNGISLNEETVVFANDNHIELLEITKVPVISNDNSIVGVLGIARDITAKKKAENLTQKLSSIGNWQWNLKTGEAEWSEEMYKIYGQSKETFYPSCKNVMSVILREDLKTFRQNMALLYADEIFYPFEFRIKRPSGEIRHLTLMSAEKSPENTIYGLIKDITEKKQLEKEKEKSLLKLEKTKTELFEAQKLGQIGSWLLNPKNKKVEWSEETYHIWGFDFNKNIPKYDTIINLIHPDDFEFVMNSVKIVSTMGIPFDIKFRICIPNRPEKTLRSVCNPVRDANGNIVNLKGTNQDITEQVNQEKKVLKVGLDSRAMKSAVDLGWSSAEFTMEGIILRANYNFVTDFGYSSKKEFIGKHHKIFYDPSYENSDSYERFWKDLANGKEQKGEFKRIKKDGSTIWIHATYTPVKDINGNYYKVIKIASDISEMVTTRSKVTAIANELRQFIETANAPIFGIDSQGLVNEWNQTSEKITGFTKKDVLGKDLVQTYITEDYQKAVKQVLDDALLGKETANYEFPLFTKTKERVMVLLNSSTRRNANGEVTGVLGVGQDITQIDKLRTESESIAKELRQFIETANAPIFGIDSQGLVNEWNQTSEKITGFTKQEVLGKNLLQTYIRPDDQEAVKKVLDNALVGLETANFEFPLFTKTKERVMVLLNSSTRRNANGDVTGVLGVGQDITELVGYRNQLELKVNQRTLKLNEALKKEKELSELKSKFVSTASHEFRTPLSSINFAAGSIKKYYSKMEPNVIEKKLHKIEDQVMHMTKLLDDILVVGQAEAGKLMYNPIHLNLGDFIYEIIEEVGNSHNTRHKILLIDDEKLKKTSIFIDEKLGRNIFINIISNAVKFSPDADTVTVEFSTEKNYTVISVIDFGIGIPKAELSNIFNPFIRGENVDLIQGTGLGLSIVKEAVDVLGGKIIVNSKIGKGTSFVVKIPKNLK
ncbi:MAG: PAS domain S-box protein, partial [Polaribacter sp.]|nr:PAS domain S-box protein [Polaribacter sp.]